MFDRYILASNKSRISKHFNVIEERGMDNYYPAFNISVNDECSVIADHKSMEFRQFQFGISANNKTTPFVRAEGKTGIKMTIPIIQVLKPYS